MEWHPVTTPEDPDFEPLFRLYQSGFPLHEQRTREKEEAILAHPACRTLALRERGAFAGLLALWEGEDFTYVEHFAIQPELRGSGLGGRVMEKLMGQGKPVVLEIDPPVDETARRREGFYRRAGFYPNPWPHIHPPYRPGYTGHQLVVMTGPEPLSRARWEDFSRFLRETVMADCNTEKK